MTSFSSVKFQSCAREVGWWGSNENTLAEPLVRLNTLFGSLSDTTSLLFFPAMIVGAVRISQFRTPSGDRAASLGLL
jgi:hypothetical protein